VSPGQVVRVVGEATPGTGVVKECAFIRPQSARRGVSTIRSKSPQVAERDRPAGRWFGQIKITPGPRTQNRCFNPEIAID